MPDDARITVRPFRSGDETAILDLFSRSFPHSPRSIEHFAWKYLQNPAGNGRISLGFLDGKLVSHYAGYPVSFHAFDRTVVAHQVGDTMTEVHVRHLGRGPTSVLGRTALHFYSEFCEGKIGFNYGFNVANIQKFSLRFLRSDRVAPVGYRRLEGAADAAPRFAALERFARGIRLTPVTEVDKEWDAFFDRVAGSYRFLVRRDAAYLKWRYLQRPDLSYRVIEIRQFGRLAGWVVFRRDGDRLLWGDALFDPQLDVVVPALHAVFSAEAPGIVEGWFGSCPGWFAGALDRLGFHAVPEPQELSVMCVPFTWNDAVERMRSDLYYTWGDSDLF